MTSASCRIALAPLRELEPANDFEIEALHQIGEERAIAARADQRGAAPLGQIALDHERQKEEPIVPERADVAFVRRTADDAGAIVDFEAQGARPKLQEPMTEGDQPARAPAFDFHVAFQR